MFVKVSFPLQRYNAFRKDGQEQGLLQEVSGKLFIGFKWLCKYVPVLSYDVTMASPIW